MREQKSEHSGAAPQGLCRVSNIRHRAFRQRNYVARQELSVRSETSDKCTEYTVLFVLVIEEIPFGSALLSSHTACAYEADDGAWMVVTIMIVQRAPLHGGGSVCRLFECDARLVTAEVTEAQFPGEIHTLKVVPTSNPTSVCADSEAEREVDELKVEDREVEPPGLPKACSEATGRLLEYGSP